jgi:transcription elongation factor Elf1
MGKRKSSKPPPKKKKAKLATVFDCPFCNSSKSVSCNLELEKEIGTVQCHTCKAEFKSNISQLTEPIDVYSDWIDACDVANA